MISTTSTYNRKIVDNDPYTLYIFTDNASRSSGNNIIDSDSWYSIEFGLGKTYPNKTSACIRGLNNAYPITTMKTYVSGGDYRLNRWNDFDIEEFKQIIDKDIDRIKNALSSNKYLLVVFPEGGIFGTKISNITGKRCPLIYNYLSIKLDELHIFINNLKISLFD